MPDVNQIELHIWNHQKETVKYCQEQGIAVEGYCPLARGKRFGQTKLKDIAEKLGKSEAEVALRWSIQKGYVTIPKSTNESRIISNLAVLEWEIPEEVMTEAEDLDEGFEASLSVKTMTVPWLG
jgi:diketogulonate reductase-like aldo/keto reductase